MKTKQPKLTQGNLFFDQNKIKKMDRFEQFMYWIVERHNVYKQKEVGAPKPWTPDPIIQSTSFTNVYRELDKTTIWYRKNIGNLNAFDKNDIVFATIAFRWFNLISTGEMLLESRHLYKWNTKDVISLLREKKPVFTGAFVISNGGPAGVGVDKLTYVCNEYIKPIWKDRQRIVDRLQKIETLEKMHQFLQQYKGFGGTGFMAAQVVCDLKYVQPYRQAEDWWTWCSQGPGSAKGLNYLLTGKLEGKHYSHDDWARAIGNLRRVVNLRLTAERMEKLHAQDLQSCLCEFSKYIHVLNGGRAKRNYKGR